MLNLNKYINFTYEELESLRLALLQARYYNESEIKGPKSVLINTERCFELSEKIREHFLKINPNDNSNNFFNNPNNFFDGGN